MGFGTLTLSYDGEDDIVIETVTSFGESFSKSGTVTPLVSMSVDDACGIESGSSKTYNISFTRKNPQSGSGSRGWSNATWLTRLTRAVNRWQCKTNGFNLTFTPDDDNPYIGPKSERGYVKNLIVRYRDDGNEILTGSLEFHVGTMMVRNPSSGEAAVNRSDFAIIMYTSDGSTPCPLMANLDDEENGVNCIESYTLYGGLEQPFEYITMDIPKKKLAAVAPALTEDIVAGKNALVVNAIGKSNMTVTKCKLRNGTYSITAYTNLERIRGYKLSNGGSMTPYAWIRYILVEDSTYGANLTDSGDEPTLHVALQNNPVENSDLLYFESGTNVWYILQIAAMYLGARIFFAEDCAYLVDYRTTSHSETIGDPYKTYGDLDLYTTDSTDPIYARVTGNVSLGDEGVDTIINTISIYHSTEFGTVQNDASRICSDSASIRVFGEREGSTLYMPNLAQTPDDQIPEEPTEPTDPEDPGTGEELPTITVYTQAQTFGDNYISYRREPQQSIEFTLKEFEQNGTRVVWRPFFNVSAMATSIIDTVNSVGINNQSVIDGTTQTQLLTLSTYERHFPEGTTTYTWGVQANIDLSSSTSQILSNMGSI